MSHDHICDPANPDCAAYLFYSNPENRRIVGPARHPERVGMTLVRGAIVSVPRRFLGGRPLTENSAWRRTKVTLAASTAVPDPGF